MIAHNKPTITKKDIDAVAKTLKTGLISQGKRVSEFETCFSAMHSSMNAIAVNSGTSALHLALLSLNVTRGTEVIIPSYVCSALLNAISYVGAKPCFADIDDDLNISPDDVKRKITKKTKAVIVPHLFGLSAKVNDLKKLGVPLIEDCAQSIGAKYRDKLTGTYGNISIFSFYSTKLITTCGEGGMILTRSNPTSDLLRDLRDYDEKRISKERYNYKMTDTSASMGITQLRQLKTLIMKRKDIAKHYNNAFKNKEFYLDRNRSGNNIYFRYLIKCDGNADYLIKKAGKMGISIKRPIFYPLHRYTNISDKSLPNTAKYWESILSIPIYPSLTKKEIEKVTSFLLNS